MKALLLVALIAATACWRSGIERPPLGGRGGTGVTPAGSAGSDLRDPALSQKTVTSKEPPTTLVAFDGSTCLVTEKRFREFVVGEKAWCVWVFRK
jgi:hypothetical protein